MSAGVPVRRTPSGRPNPFAFRVLPDGRSVEVGMKLLELSYGPDDALWPRLEEFRPGVSHRAWIMLIDSYVRDLIEPSEEVERAAVLGRRSIVDPFLSGDPSSVFELLDPWDEDEARDELGFLRGVTRSVVADWFSEAAEWSCGQVLWQRVVWPVLYKIAGWTEVPASQHRKVWLPLWRTETLWDAVRGEPSYRPVRPMHFGCGAFHEALERSVAEVSGPARGNEFTLFDASVLTYPRMKSPRSVEIGVAWVDDPEHEQGVEWLIDADNPVFRRTWDGSGVCCVEYAAGANIDRWAYDLSFEVLDKLAVRVPIGDVVVDDPRAIGYGNLNDQIVQGLAAADRLMRERA